MKRLLAIFVLLSPAFGTVHYLDCAVSVSGNGLSWATAWKNFSNVTGVAPGDVVNLSGGTTSQTCTTGEFLSASGTSGNPITYQVSTDAGHNGILTIQNGGGADFFAGQPGNNIGQWVTISGNVGGARNLIINGWATVFEVQASVGIVLRYLTVNNVATGNNNNPIWDGFGGTSIEFDHVLFNLASGADHAVNGPGGGGTSYTTNLIHDSIFKMRYLPGGGFGDDGFHWTSHTSFYNNQFLGVSDSSYPGNQHMDGIQSYGPYLQIYGNYFENFMNYPIYGDGTPGNSIQHWRIFNNTFYNPAAGNASQAIALGCDGTTCDQSDLLIANNTVTSIAICITINNGTSGTFSNNFVYNNICYNAGNILTPGGAATVANNVTSTTNVHFVNFPTDLHETSASTATIGQGVNPAPATLTNVYTTDKDGLPRVNPWDIGAYQFSAAGPVFSPSANPLAIGNVNVGSNSSPTVETITNSGTTNLVIGTLSSSNARFTLSADTCSGATVPASSTCHVSVTFSPLAAGAQSATITVPDNAGNPDTFTATGTGLGVGPAVSFSLTSIAFGNQLVRTSKSIVETLTNTGNATLNISGISLLTGTQFSIVNACGLTLGAGNSCNVTVTFTPTTGGAKSDTLTFTTDAVSSPDNVAITGAGVLFSFVPRSLPSAPSCTVGGQSPSASNIWTFNCTPALTGDVVIAGVSCHPTSGTITTVTLTAPGWSFFQRAGPTGTGAGTVAALFGAIAPNSAATTFTATFDNAGHTIANCSTSAVFLSGEFSGGDHTGGATTFNAGASSGAGSGGCNAAIVTPPLNNEAVWSFCLDTVSLLNSPWLSGIDDAGSGDVAAYQILSGGAGVPQTPTFVSSGAYINLSAAIAPGGPGAAIGSNIGIGANIGHH